MTSGETPAVTELANALVLGALLDSVRVRWGKYKVLGHWQQGEFHHDVILEVEHADDLPGRVLLVATNCNGGVKEVLCLPAPPDRGGLWHLRCPDNAEFIGPAPEILASARTPHWFEPCELLLPTARSEYKAEYRDRQCGGGWLPRGGSA